MTAATFATNKPHILHVFLLKSFVCYAQTVIFMLGEAKIPEQDLKCIH